MTTELFLDLLLSFAVLYVYHSDLQASRPAYACEGNDLIFGSHQEYAPEVTCLPDDESWLAEFVYAPAPADWILDPTEAVVSVETRSETAARQGFVDSIEMNLAQMFALADSIVPMEPASAAELATIEAEINELCPEGSGAGPVLDMLKAFATPAVSVETKGATVPQLKVLAKALGLKPAAKKADLNEQVLNAFADQDLSSYSIDDRTFVPSADDTEMRVAV